MTIPQEYIEDLKNKYKWPELKLTSDKQSYLYALYIWKLFVWSSKHNVLPPRFQVISYNDINTDGLLELESICEEDGLDPVDVYNHQTQYDLDLPIVIYGYFDEEVGHYVRAFPSSVDPATKPMIKGLFLLGKCLKECDKQFNLITVDNMFGRTEEKFEFSSNVDEDFDSFTDKLIMHAVQYTENFIDEFYHGTIPVNGFVADFNDNDITCNSVAPIDCRYDGVIEGTEDYTSAEGDYLNKIWDIEKRISSNKLVDKFINISKFGYKIRGIALNDIFDYYNTLFDAKTFNTDSSQMDALLDFDLNTFDIAPYIPEKFIPAYEKLTKLVKK